jgi:hypothetical protein
MLPGDYGQDYKWNWVEATDRDELNGPDDAQHTRRSAETHSQSLEAMQDCSAA